MKFQAWVPYMMYKNIDLGPNYYEARSQRGKMLQVDYHLKNFADFFLGLPGVKKDRGVGEHLHYLHIRSWIPPGSIRTGQGQGDAV